MTREPYGTDHRKVKDWLKYPELGLLERFDFLAPALLAVSMLVLGEVVQAVWLQSGTSGLQMLVWEFIISTITLGEGWHKNHHHFPSSARQGFRRWEIDISYCLLVVMSWFGLVWDLKPVPARALQPTRIPADERA